MLLQSFHLKIISEILNFSSFAIIIIRILNGAITNILVIWEFFILQHYITTLT